MHIPHAHMHSHTPHAHTHSDTHFMHTHTPLHTHTHIHTSYTYTHTHETHAHTLTYTPHAHIHTHTHTHKYLIHTHSHIPHAHIYIHPCAHSLTLTHTPHTYTFTYRPHAHTHMAGTRERIPHCCPLPPATQSQCSAEPPSVNDVVTAHLTLFLLLRLSNPNSRHDRAKNAKNKKVTSGHSHTDILPLYPCWILLTTVVEDLTAHSGAAEDTA